MLARRTRIKGIANIPQRKKAEEPKTLPDPQTSSQESPAPEIKPETPIKTETNTVEPKQEHVSEQPPAEPEKVEDIQETKPPAVRRKFLKPGINLNSIKQRNPVPKVEPAQEPPGPSKVVLLSEVRIPSVCNVTKLISEPSSEGETPVCEEPLDVPILAAPKRVIIETPVSDSEYPAPPPSPSKINRARIKAVPKFGLRKASCSASESEDESRKYGRIRNNSVCSVEPPQTPKPPENWQKKEEIAPVQKKVHRTEQSRKLAEARREFYKKFGTTVPDKHKLRMIDLIFYNPSTSPIIKKEGHKETSEQEEVVEESKVPLETPQPVEEENLPVPQIKIGPSGEIILDEQSLVVENKELAKQKEQMQKSNVVDGDFDTGYGVYKKVRRSTPWSEKETLKFYKALNCIGTDFTAMSQLFPKRSRRDLKMKFKKEEKLNRNLINKAVRQHCFYNFADLKREAQVEAEEEAFLAKLREEETRKKKEERAEKLRKHQEKFGIKKGEEEVTEAVTSNPHIEETIEEVLRSVRDDTEKEEEKPLIKKRISGGKRRKSLKALSSSDEDADVSDCEEEEEFIPFLKPTRSGRMPKSTIKFLEEDESLKRRRPSIQSDNPEKIKKPRGAPRKVPDMCSSRLRRFSSTSSIDSNADKLVPGSVVVTTEENTDGKFEYKVFMVTPERKLTSLELESDVIAMLVAEKQDTATATLPPSKEDENNVTIPEGLAQCDNVEIVDEEVVVEKVDNVVVVESVYPNVFVEGEVEVVAHVD